MSETEGPAPGYEDLHTCVPVVHHCWKTCGYRLHSGHGADMDSDYVRWEDRRGTVRRVNLDDRTYADLDAEDRVVGVGFRQSHGPAGCRHPEAVRDHIGIPKPGTPLYGPLLDDVLAHEPCKCHPGIPASVVVGVYPEDGGMVGWSWIVDSAEAAEALAAELTERLGKSQEVALDRIGVHHMREVADLAAIAWEQWEEEAS